MFTYVLIFILVIFCIIVYNRYFSGGIASPVSMFFYGILASVTLSIIGLFSWNSVQNISFQVLVILGLGIVATALGAATSTRLYPHSDTKGGFRRFSLQIPVWKFLLIDLLVFIAIIIRVSDVIRIATAMGVGDVSYPAMVAAVRNVTSAFVTTENSQTALDYTVLARQTEKFVDASGFVGCFLLVYSASTKKPIPQIANSAILLLISTAYVLLSGSRSIIFLWLIASIFYYFLIQQPSLNAIRSKPTKLLCIVVMATLLAALFFYLSSIIVGRASNSDLIAYISFYFGSPIPSFESLVESGSVSSISPQLVFYNLCAFLSKVGLMSGLPSYSISWVAFSDFGSNVFTCFARYYFAFGYFGVIAFSYLSGLIIELPYRYANSAKSIPVAIISGYIAANAFDMIREEFVFSRLFSMAQLMTLIVMLVIALFLIEPHLNRLRWNHTTAK